MSEPTPPLDEFIERYRKDDNAWWRLDSGHHMNLFDEAWDRMEEAEKATARVRELHQPSNPIWPEGFVVCRAGCEGDYPCPTIKALDGTDGSDHE